MTFEDFWNKNYARSYGPMTEAKEPYYSIASNAWRMGYKEGKESIPKSIPSLGNGIKALFEGLEDPSENRW